IRGSTYSEALTSIYVHEIAHNLGAVHGDPGNAMDYFTKSTFSKENMVGSSGNVARSGNSPVTINKIKVNSSSIKAIIGRIGQGKLAHPQESKYLNDKEKKRIKKESKVGELQKWPQ